MSMFYKMIGPLGGLALAYTLILYTFFTIELILVFTSSLGYVTADPLVKTFFLPINMIGSALLLVAGLQLLHSRKRRPC